MCRTSVSKFRAQQPGCRVSKISPPQPARECTVHKHTLRTSSSLKTIVGCSCCITRPSCKIPRKLSDQLFPLVPRTHSATHTNTRRTAIPNTATISFMCACLETAVPARTSSAPRKEESWRPTIPEAYGIQAYPCPKSGRKRRHSLTKEPGLQGRDYEKIAEACPRKWRMRSTPQNREWLH